MVTLFVALKTVQNKLLIKIFTKKLTVKTSMKKLIWVFIFTLSVTAIHAQDYFVSFAAAGASTIVSTVKVDNLTKGTTVTLNGDDILHLTGVVGLPEMESKTNFHLNVYPNPMKSSCKIDFTKAISGLTLIGLYDVSGKLVLETQELLSRGRHSYILSGIGKGIYLLKIRSDKYSVTSKIVCTAEIAGITELKHYAVNSTSDSQNTASLYQESTGLKSSESTIEMAYSDGDVIFFTASSGSSNKTNYILTNPTEVPKIIFEFRDCKDGDDYAYPVVKIGAHWWMTQNLKTTRYKDGTLLPTDGNWNNQQNPAYCSYLNTSNSDTLNTYGRLYNWYAVNTAKLCPVGWHVPSHDEWTGLKDYLGATSITGGYLKETGTLHWKSPNQYANNLTGFTALPAGLRDGDGVFNYIGLYGYFWSSTQAGATTAKYWSLEYNNGGFMQDPTIRSTGLSVRCTND